MAIQFHSPKDRFSLQLAVGIDAFQTDFQYASGGELCPPVPYIMYMDLEKLNITEQAGNDVTQCQRAYDGTTPAPHVAGTEVKLLDTSKHIRELHDADAEFHRIIRRMTGGVDGVFRDAEPPLNFLVTEQAVPNMTVLVAAGEGVVNGKGVAPAAAQNSPLMVAPVANPRIDLIEIDEFGAVWVKTGVEGAVPAPPAVTAGRLALWDVYHRVGEASIKTVDDAVNGYRSTDRRSYL